MDWGRDINVTGALLKTKLCYLLRWLDDMDFTNFPTVGLCILALAEAFLRKNLPTSDNLFFSGVAIPKFFGEFGNMDLTLNL